MLINAGVHGHKYAVDAAVAEMALRQRRPVVLLTSDIDGMTELCCGKVRLVVVQRVLITRLGLLRWRAIPGLGVLL
jgi:hypothetical protein